MPYLVVDRTLLAEKGPTLQNATWYRVEWNKATPVKVSGKPLLDDTTSNATMYTGFPNGVIASEKPRYPRPVTVAAKAPAVYGGFSKTLFIGMGHTPKKIQLGPLVRADLDGDGTIEAIWQATADDTPSGQSKAASAIFLRRLTPKGMKTLILHRSVGGHMEFERGKIRAVADLNGDGKMEIVLTVEGYEWWYSQVWTLSTKGLTKLAEGGGGV